MCLREMFNRDMQNGMIGYEVRSNHHLLACVLVFMLVCARCIRNTHR